jgi:hypothetical protein
MPKPIVTSVSKGAFVGKIEVNWKYDFVKYPSDKVWFEAQRRTLVNPTSGKFSDWKPMKPKNNSTKWDTLTNKVYGDKLTDDYELKSLTWYAYQVKAAVKGGKSEWSKEEYGFIKDASKIAAAILYEPQDAYQLTWSAVQGATRYRLQIIERVPGRPYNQDPKKGFYNVPILLDTLLNAPYYVWAGQPKAILWSVQAIHEVNSGYFPHPLHADSMLPYGRDSQRDSLLKWLGFHSGNVSILIQNRTQRVLMDLNVGIYLSKESKFNPQEAVLAKSLPIYLPPEKQIEISEQLEVAGYKYVHLVPVQSGLILKAEIETMPIPN